MTSHSIIDHIEWSRNQIQWYQFLDSTYSINTETHTQLRASHDYKLCSNYLAKVTMNSVADAPGQNDVVDHNAEQHKLGQWEPIKDVKDQYVQELERFGVMEAEKESGKNLIFKVWILERGKWFVE